MLHVVTIVGARPQFVKAGPVSRAIAAHDGLRETLVHTGQHFDEAMSDVFFADLQLPVPTYNLGISSASHGQMTGRMLAAIEDVLLSERADAVLVYGDTNSTLAGALAAAKLEIPIIHVEAGLRSFNRRMPEEINRVITDHLAQLQFCPTHAAVENLGREGIRAGVFHTGDVMFDATVFALHAVSENPARFENVAGLDGAAYSVGTLHRAENTDDPDCLRAVCSYLAEVAQETRLVLPLHPRTRKALARHGLAIHGAKVMDPLGYFEFHALIAGADTIYTDSGGLQKEAYFHRKPCVTMRGETEWIETIEHGWNRLWHDNAYRLPRCDIAEYGAGNAAEQMVGLIAEQLA